MELRVKDAKMLFDQGSILGWHLDNFHDEWVLYLKMKKGGEQQLYGHRGDLRYFKSLDAGVSAVRAIGFEVSSLTQ